jgi:GNAT superfamily N-acetyltransferase
MKISIADRRSNAEQLSRFFAQNLTTSYISHSELQGFRAVRPGVWAANIESVLDAEIRQRLVDPLDQFPADANWKGVIEAHDDGKLVGLALVTISREAAVTYAILEDIVVDDSRRGHGIGRVMTDWIIAELRRAGIQRIFLESGRDNAAAHHFFERCGFKQVSIVMMRDI